jgi:hypothetical protein
MALRDAIEMGSRVSDCGYGRDPMRRLLRYKSEGGAQDAGPAHCRYRTFDPRVRQVPFVVRGHIRHS